MFSSATLTRPSDFTGSRVLRRGQGNQPQSSCKERVKRVSTWASEGEWRAHQGRLPSLQATLHPPHCRGRTLGFPVLLSVPDQR